MASTEEEFDYSADVPPELPGCIGQVMMNFSLVESSLNHLIWECLGISYQDGVPLTARLDVRPKIQILQAALRHIEEPLRDELSDVLETIGDDTQHRNACAHGM
jgi:hypothetical protein